jgi:hypothetical protein
MILGVAAVAVVVEDLAEDVVKRVSIFIFIIIIKLHSTLLSNNG